MPEGEIPGPLGRRPDEMDEGTLNRQRTPPPGAVGQRVPGRFERFIDWFEEQKRDTATSVRIYSPELVSSIEGENIMAVVGFLESMGESKSANGIRQLLREGSLFYDENEAERGDTGRAFGMLTLGSGELPAAGGEKLIDVLRTRRLELDSEIGFARTVEMARTLFHERIHSQEQTTVSDNIVTLSILGSLRSWHLWLRGGELSKKMNDNQKMIWEIPAHTETIYALERWCSRYRDEAARLPWERRAERLRALKRARVILSIKIAAVRSFAEGAERGYGVLSLEPWRQEKKRSTGALGDLDAQIAELEYDLAGRPLPPGKGERTCPCPKTQVAEGSAEGTGTSADERDAISMAKSDAMGRARKAANAAKSKHSCKRPCVPDFDDDVAPAEVVGRVATAPNALNPKVTMYTATAQSAWKLHLTCTRAASGD